MISSLVFLILSGITAFFAFKRYTQIYANIRLGQPYVLQNSVSQRIKNLLLFSLGQKKMFQRPIAAVFHFFVYAAFIFTQIELIEMILDGLLDRHRIVFHAVSDSWLSFAYTALVNWVEVLSLLAFIATLVFLSRRNLLKLPRLVHEDLKGWPITDAHLILIAEILLVLSIFTMNSIDAYLWRGSEHEHMFWLSSYLAGIWEGVNPQTLQLLAKAAWWLHMLVVLGFIAYLPYSKHLHIVLAFFNGYFMNEEPKGKMPFMPHIFNEIKSMMDPSFTSEQNAETMIFGAKDVPELTWKNLLDAYSCTECGRCTDECPANKTGKLLSPRKIMMKTRDRMEDFSLFRDLNPDKLSDDKQLLGDYITQEELRACTTCNACVEACPVGISPLDIIMSLRRNLIMEQSDSPQEWNMMFGNVENNGAPWKFAQDARANWIKE